MNLSNYKTTLGGALSALGKTLMGVGIVPQLGGTPSKFLTGCAALGFLLDAVGGFFAHLFSADAKTLQSLANVVSDTGTSEVKAAMVDKGIPVTDK